MYCFELRTWWFDIYCQLMTRRGNGTARLMEIRQMLADLWMGSRPNSWRTVEATFPQDKDNVVVSLVFASRFWQQLDSPPQLMTPRGNNGIFASPPFRQAVDRLLVGLDLFAGHPTFGSRRQQLETVLGTVKAKKVALHLPVIRGRAQLIDLDDDVYILQ